MLPAAFLRKERVLNKHADDAPETGVEVVVGLELDAVVLEDEGESRSAAVLLSKKRYKYPKKKRESRSAKVAGAQEHRDVLDDFAMYLRPALELCSKLVCLMLSFLTCCRCRQRERFIDAVVAGSPRTTSSFVLILGRIRIVIGKAGAATSDGLRVAVAPLRRGRRLGWRALSWRRASEAW